LDLVGWRLRERPHFAISEKAQRAVLYALIDKARDDGTRIFPSIATICAETGLKERMVQYVVKLFRQVGLLIPRSVKGGRGRTASYDLDVEMLEALTQLEEDSHDQMQFRLLVAVPEANGKGAPTDKGCTADRKGCTGDQKRVHPGAPDPLEPLEPLAQQSGAAPSQASVVETAARVHRDAAAALGVAPDQAAHEFATVLAWVTAGHADRVVPTIMRVLKRRRGQLPTSWSYFTPAIEERPAAPVPAPAQRDAPPDWELHLTWYKRAIQSAKRKGLMGIPYHAWHRELGPMPGESGCRVPLEILRRHGFAA